MGKRGRRREREVGERKAPNDPKPEPVLAIVDEVDPADDPIYAKYVQDKMDGKLD